MSGVNKVILLGRLGKDPELKYAPSGAAMCRFSIATSESWTDKQGQKQEKTEWHNIVVWNKLAELCNQYLAKGRQVYIEGKLQTDSWEDEKGTKKYQTNIIAAVAQFVGEKAAGTGTGAGRPAPAETGPSSNDHFTNDASFASDDIPF